ncbi:hypothetical protein H0484_03010 [Pusillimonas sp. CC-YST705]|uniref:Carboxypeptidase regulatory-like domain-containing protein n=1 Tax=Mesopusillimonas faecipullorum TaxID=2755040 RepID=A0ABS8C9M4_9BURK|nr:hypothetical protein [Mesopusillimonas faecipullorum]MCB5362725.1 hypothetical protein [Mesopusillimonas faecipullorum]
MRQLKAQAIDQDLAPSLTKRRLLKMGLLTPALMALSACGGDGDSDSNSARGSEPQAGPWTLEGEESLAADVSDTPFGDAYDLSLDPLALVNAQILGLVEYEGSYPIAVAAYTHDGVLIGQTMTDARGYYTISGQARSGMRIVAKTSNGDLSAYEIGREFVDDEPIYVNALTTLVDRLRLATGWRYSQAEDRLQDFLGLERNTPIQMPLAGHSDFALDVFHASRQQAGMSLDAYIDDLVAQAYAEPMLSQAVSFASPLQSGGLALDPMGVVSFFGKKLLDFINGSLSDEEKEEFFGGWLVKFGVFTTTDPMEKAIAELSAQVAIVVSDVNALLKKLDDKDLNDTVGPVNDLIRECYNISNDMRALQKYENLKDYQLRAAQIREAIDKNLGKTPYNIAQLFIGFPGQLGKGNTVIDALNRSIQRSNAVHFYGKASENLFKRYVASLRMFQMYIITLKVMRLLSLKYLEGQAIDETYLQELCQAAIQYDKVFAQIDVKPLPDEMVYIDLRTDYAWWAHPSLADYYGTWRGDDMLMNSPDKFPAAIKAMGDQAWEVPLRVDVEEPFFKESKARGLSFKSYITSFGGPAQGFYDVSGLKNAPKFNFWLANTVQTYEPYIDTRPPIIFYYSQRNYARPASKERDFRISKSSYCDDNTRERRCTTEDFGNYGGYKNYFYPVNKHVIKPEQYYPWVVFAEIREKYKNFDHDTIMKQK